MEKLRVNIPTITQGILSPGLAKAYREVLGELSKGDKFAPKKVPTLKLDDWMREAILKGQRISKIDQKVFKEALI